MGCRVGDIEKQERLNTKELVLSKIHWHLSVSLPLFY
jgi:hypothetical protein